MLYVYRHCPTCNGTGTYSRIDADEPDGIKEINPCPMCDGSGRLFLFEVNAEEVEDTLRWVKSKIKKILKELNVEEDDD